MSKKNPIKYVITCEPERPGPDPSQYFGPDGKPTGLNNAEEFWSWASAQQFADAYGIKIDGAMRSIVVSRRKPVNK